MAVKCFQKIAKPNCFFTKVDNKKIDKNMKYLRIFFIKIFFHMLIKFYKLLRYRPLKDYE